MGSDLDAALRQFEAVEANLARLEKLWEEIVALIPKGIAFASGGAEGIAYEEKCRVFRRITASMPAIDGWSLDVELYDLNAIAQWRLDTKEIDEIEAMVSCEEAILRPGELLREYRSRFAAKRRELVRRRVQALIGEFEADLTAVQSTAEEKKPGASVMCPEWERMRNAADQIDTLLGSSVARPPRWGDLRRHLHFAQTNDLNDIVAYDWPAVKPALDRSLYGEEDPLPVDIEDLAELTAQHPSGPVATKLQWEALSDEDFERLVFCLIGATPGYENPQWLTRTHAPDRGRDLSVVRVREDALAGTQRSRVIIQCKHWLTKSVGPADVSIARDQMALWEPPPVDVLVICTSGRFTTDAVELIEKHNAGSSRLAIEMWPESSLERLLAQRPHFVAEFRLRS